MAAYDTSAALAKTEDRSLALDLKPRQMHNLIKASLIQKYAGERVLDLACGRGGDLSKYCNGTTHYTGIDISSESIAEAKSRATNVKMQAEFEVQDIMGLEIDQFPAASIHTVSCMFALHYFWDRLEHINKLLHQVSTWLKPGGTFIGVIPDAESVMDCAAEALLSSGRNKFQHPLFSLEFGSAIHQTMLYFKPPDCKWGMSYFFNLTASKLVQNSLEYLVPMPEFVTLAKTHNLELIHSEGLQSYYYKQDLKGLQTSMKFDGNLSQSEWRLCSMYRTFVFIKL
jgi:mRNA (guanine-N7-)-methyltransferase